MKQVLLTDRYILGKLYFASKGLKLNDCKLPFI